MGPETTAELVLRFSTCTLPKGEWTHQAHLSVGLWHVHEHGADDALDRLRIAIRRLNDSHGTPNTETRGYHETITRAYVVLLEQFHATCPADMELEARRDRLLASEVAARDYLLRFWTSELLMSPTARAQWVEPDRAPLTL